MHAIFDTGPFAPCPSPFNLAAHVLAHAPRLADKIALAVVSPSGADRWSYAKLQAAVLGTATGLAQAGFQPGDVVLMRLGNTVDFPIAYLGAIAAGMVPVPTSSQLTAPEVASLLEGLQPAGILHDPAVPCADPAGAQLVDLPALHSMRSLPPAPYHMGAPDRLAYIVYTSGTSGRPRAVMHAHRAIWARQMMHQGWYGITEEDRLMHAGAFNWTFTLGTGLLDPWSVGATTLIPAQGVPPEALPLLLKRHDATIFAAAPGVYRKVLGQAQPLPLPRLRHGLAAGEKLPETTRAAWQAATGTPVFEAYGMSEISTFISANPQAPARATMLGQPQPGRRVAIVDSNGTPVPIGSPGTIAVSRRDPGLMLGYRNAAEDTKLRFAGEWFLTGDQGHMEEDGQIAYHGRDDDMMNAGGYRVSPLEVEAALLAFPGLREAAVTDIEVKPDVRVIAAFYLADHPLDHAALQAHCETLLARYKQPRLFTHVQALPRNPNGKLSRQSLRKEFRLNK